MRAKAMHQIAKQRAGGRARLPGMRFGMELNQCLARRQTNCLLRLEELEVLGPHQLHVANRTGVVQQYEDVLKEFKILFKFLLEGTAERRLLLLHKCGPFLPTYERRNHMCYAT